MTEEPTDYSRIYEFLYRIDRRVGYLEKDALFIEKKINTLEESRVKEFKTLGEELGELRKNITLLKNNLSQCAHGMARLGKDMKDSVKKEELDGVNTQLDEIKFEEYVTSNDIKRGL
jgi:hypothetical protein